MQKINRFAGYQEAGQKSRIKIIEDYLRMLSKTRVVARNPTNLAELVAVHIRRETGRPCVRSTLLRNVRYKSLLLSYIASNGGIEKVHGKDYICNGDATRPVRVVTAELKEGNARREVGRLNIYIKSLEKQLTENQHRSISVDDTKLVAPSADTRLLDVEIKFYLTCQALRAVLSNLNNVLEIDTQGRRILDRSRRRNNVIVDSSLAAPFIEWYVALPKDNAI